MDGAPAASDGLLRSSQGTCSKNWNTLPAPPKSSRLHSPTKSAAIDINSQFEPGFPLGLSRKKGLQSTRNAVPEVVPELEVNSEIRTPERASKDSSQQNSPERNDGHPDDIKYTFIPAAEAVSLTASYDAIKDESQQRHWASSSSGGDTSTLPPEPPALPPPKLPPTRLTSRSGLKSPRVVPPMRHHKIGSLTERPHGAYIDAHGSSSRGQSSMFTRDSSTMQRQLQQQPQQQQEHGLGSLSRPTTEPWHLAPTDPPRLDQPFAPRLGPRGRGFGPPPPSAPSPSDDLLSQRRPPSLVPSRTIDPIATEKVLPPKSVLPLKYHVREATPVRPPEEELGSYTADWDGYNELWQVTVFPAQRPDGREQIGHLRNCLNRMLRAEGQAAVSVGIVPPGTQPSLLQILDGAPDADRTYRVLHSIFAAGMHEIARQVSCNCAERGQLMMNVWSSVEALRERMLEIREERVRKAERETEQVKKDLAHAQERLQALEDVESSNAQKDADLAKLMQSREQHLEMMKTLRAALASLEEQLRASHASRKAAEAKLRTWLPHYDTYSSNAALEALEAHEAASRELSAEVAPVGDTDGKATVSASGDDAEELKARAAQWRASVRAQAAQLADWEASPSLPDDVPLDVEALKLLMQDAGRILGAVVCLRDDSAEGGTRDGSSGSTDKERAARDQQTIVNLQEQLAEARAQIHEQRLQLASAGAASGKKRAGGKSLIMPQGSLELPEPL